MSKPNDGGNEVWRLARLVKLMRHCQAEYFKTRNSALVGQCKDLEKRVDRAVEWVLTHRTGVVPTSAEPQAPPKTAVEPRQGVLKDLGPPEPGPGPYRRPGRS